MNRRQLLGTGVAATVTGVSLGGPSLATTAERLRKGKRLSPGDTVGIVAPASNVAENESIRFAGDVVRSLGYKVKEGKHLYQRQQYLAGSDEERAADVNAMFSDDDVDAIFCLRGGYGTPRILPYLDYSLIRANPKIFMGYSDITAVLSAMQVKSGLVGFHGVNAGQNMSDYTLTEFKKVLVTPSRRTLIGEAPPIEAREGFVEKENRITRFVGGTAIGPLVGGNLSLIATLIGTPFEPDFKRSILFLEDVGEAPYRVDRMLTQLWLAGKLQQVAGIAFGKFTRSDDNGNSFSMEEVIRMRCEPLGVPVIRGLMFGHIEDQTVVPVGLNAKLDADAGTLQLLEQAVL